MTTPQAVMTTLKLSEQEAYEIASEAYCFFYPLITMDATMRQTTNMPPGKRPGFGPANAFSHIRSYPDADFRAVVRPNFDTLYSSAWLDLRKEPLVVSAPDTSGRYYLLPILDMWTDVFASPGWRTSGTGAQNYVVVPQGWTGDLPEGLDCIESPTCFAWIIGRTKTDGPDDYKAVHEVQDGFKITPLSYWGKGTPPPAEQRIDPEIDMLTPPLETVNKMSAEEFYSKAAELLKTHRPHITDWCIMARLKRVGFEAGKSFDLNSLDAPIKEQFARARNDAQKLMLEKVKSMGRPVNGWAMNTETMGVYGNYYLKRAIVTQVGLGANLVDDAVYPLNFADADGKPLHGENKYVLHFNNDQMPPVKAFWSVTMYDADGFQVANTLKRFAISSWMPLKKNADGSLDIYIQNENPGVNLESNWLPSPASGILGITLRLYAPEAKVLNGDWNPPAIRKL